MKKILSLLFLLAFAFNLSAQFGGGLGNNKNIKNPVSWAYKLSKTEVKPGDTIEIIFLGTIEAGWYVYSSDFSPDLGPSVTEFVFEKNASYKLIGSIRPIGAHKKYEEVFEGEYTYFTGTVEFRQKIQILKDEPLIKATCTYQTCSSVDGLCLPPKDEEFLILGIKYLSDTVNAAQTKSPNNTNKTDSIATKQQATNLAELEKQKQKYVVKNSQGKDVSVEYLRRFVNKYSH